MDKQLLFDRYVEGNMSEAEIKAFQESLKKDASLATEYQIYLSTVSAIIKEEQLDCIEFATAIKQLSKDDIQKIVGKKTKPKTFSLATYWWSVSSVAAVMVIAVVLSVFFITQKHHYQVDELIWEQNQSLFVSRGGNMFEDCTDAEIEAFLPKLTQLYNKSENPKERIENGKKLAVLYIKLHQRDQARSVLEALITQYKNHADYAKAIQDLTTMLRHITE